MHNKSKSYNTILRASSFKPFLFLWAVLWVLSVSNVFADSTLRVIRVTDGDTIYVLKNKKSEKIRLSYIDAPEMGQPYGQNAKQALAEKLFKKQVRVVRHGTDQYGRTLATVYLKQENINLWMVASGHAWVYTRYTDNPLYIQAQKKAKGKKRGLWRLPKRQRIPPWVWRKTEKNRKS